MGLEDSHSSRGPSRIVIVDDHPVFRSAVRKILERHSNLEVVGEAGNGHHALELCRRLEPELVLMDLRMPVMDGIQATQAIKAELPATIVLMLTALEEPTTLADSLKAGAAGYVLKHAPASQISDAVQRVLTGESPLDEALAMRLLLRLLDRGAHNEEGGHVDSSTSATPLGQRGESPPPDNSLTPREAEVLRLVVRGQTNQQIARKLMISVSTVKRHVRHIGSKLGATDRVQAAVRAVELGVLDERNGC